MSEPTVMSSLAVLGAGVTCLCLAKFYGTIKSLAEEVENLVANVWALDRRQRVEHDDPDLADAFIQIQERAIELEAAVERLRVRAQREVPDPREILAKTAAYHRPGIGVLDQRGMALPLAMVILVVLTLMSLTFMSLGSVEPQISRNLGDGTRAHFVAESGVEWGFTQLVGKDFNDAALLGSGTTTGGLCGASVTCKVLTASTPLPGQAATRGTFSVILRNDVAVAGCDPLASAARDQMLVGCDVTPDTNATIDVNNIVILQAVGTFNGAKRTVTVVVRRGDLVVNGALHLPGARGDVSTLEPPSAGAYQIDGRDFKIADTTTPTGGAPIKFAVATTPATEAATEAGFNTLARRQFLVGLADGDNYPTSTDGGAQNGRNTIAAAPMTSTDVTKLVNWLGTAPQMGPCTLPALASSLAFCRGDVLVPGTTAGAGLLIVQNGDLLVTGSLAWTGLVVLSGPSSRVVLSPGSHLDVRGALVVSQTDPSATGPVIDNQSASLVIKASKPSIDGAMFGAANTRLMLWRRD